MTAGPLGEALGRVYVALVRALSRPGDTVEPILLAGALVSDPRGRVLLLHRNTPGTLWWEVPGGKVEPGESEAEAARRELAEELSARIEIDQKLGTGDFDYDGQRLRYTWYLAHVVEGEPRVVETDRFDQLSYFTVDEAAALLNQSPSLRRLFELQPSGLKKMCSSGSHVAPETTFRAHPA